jgi:amidohydrolase
MAARFSPNPELGNREFKTAEKLQHISVLLGLRCRRVSLNGSSRYLRGGKPGPVVALRADIDALPVKND